VWCGAISSAVNDKTMYDANRYFCDWKTYSNPVFKTEKNGFVYRGITWKNHASMCRKWVKKNPQKMETGSIGGVERIKEMMDESVNYAGLIKSGKWA
jgi:hypothetical protein